MNRADFPLLERRLDGRPLMGMGQAHLALGKPRRAVAMLEQALARFAPESSEPADRATAHFDLARALSTPPGLQERARTEALQAPEAITRAQFPGNAEAVEHWLTPRGLSSSQASHASPASSGENPPLGFDGRRQLRLAFGIQPLRHRLARGDEAQEL